jgi:hypothetical protein
MPVVLDRVAAEFVTLERLIRAGGKWISRR